MHSRARRGVRECILCDFARHDSGSNHEPRVVTKNNETFYPGPSRSHLAAFPPKERWDNWTELDSQAWPRRKERHYSLVPTTCFNCESACGLLAYIDKVTGDIQKFEGN